jgi:hypothetical protein
MKSYLLIGAALVATPSLMGCAPTYFHSSAPAQNGSIYVVGGKSGLPQAWVCPAAPKKGECQEIGVEEVGE